jgi:hypothetical protein
MSIVVDTAQWPIVQTVWDGEQTVEDVNRYIDDVKRIYARRDPFCTITFMKKYKASPEIRKRISEMMAHTEGDVKKFAICSAMITPSTAFRFVLSTVFLVKRMDTPYQVCANFEEALAFCRTEAQKRKVVLPRDVLPLVRL